AVVRRDLRRELVDEEERLLGQGRRIQGLRRLVPGLGLVARPGRGVDRRRHVLGETGQRWMLEQRSHRELHRERLADPRDRARGEQRMSAEVEEIVPRRDAVGAEY